MKSTGIVRRIDDLGRIVIPKEIRRMYGIENGDPLEINVDENGIYIQKYFPGQSATVYIEAARKVLAVAEGISEELRESMLSDVEKLLARFQKGE